MAFTLVGVLAPTAATAQTPADVPNYRLTFDLDGKCMWANGAATGSAIYKNRGGPNCSHGARDLWEFVRVGTRGGVPIYHIQFPVANPDNCLAITGTPRPGEDVQLEPCSSGDDDNWYVWDGNLNGRFHLRNSDLRYVDYCLEYDAQDRIGDVRVQVDTCGAFAGNQDLRRSHVPFS